MEAPSWKCGFLLVAASFQPGAVHCGDGILAHGLEGTEIVLTGAAQDVDEG